jgi:transposase-like protein
MRERNGKTLTFVAKSEDAGVAIMRDRIAPGSIVYADEASHWDQLHARYLTKRINHSQAYSDRNGTSTNQAESFFSRLGRAEIGIHHQVAGPYLAVHAAEMDWREGNRRLSNGQQHLAAINAAALHPVSAQWKGAIGSGVGTVENDHAISALLRKRAEIAGQIEMLQQQLRIQSASEGNMPETVYREGAARCRRLGSVTTLHDPAVAALLAFAEELETRAADIKRASTIPASKLRS